MATLTEDEVLSALKQCYDPEIPVNIVDLGLIYGVRFDPAPYVRDDRDKSLLRARDARASQDVCPSRGSWTGEMIDCLSDLPVGQSTLLGRLSALASRQGAAAAR